MKERKKEKKEKKEKSPISVEGFNLTTKKKTSDPLHFKKISALFSFFKFEFVIQRPSPTLFISLIFTFFFTDPSPPPLSLLLLLLPHRLSSSSPPTQLDFSHKSFIRKCHVNKLLVILFFLLFLSPFSFPSCLLFPFPSTNPLPSPPHAHIQKKKK